MEKDLLEAKLEIAKLKDTLAAETARADAAEVEAKNAKADLETEKKARTDAAESFPARVRARVALEKAAAPILGAEVKLDEMTDREIKVAVVKKVDDDEIPAERSDDYVDGLYTGAVKRAGAAGDALAGLREVAAAAPRTDAKRDDAEKARQEMIEYNRNAWKAGAEA